MILITTTKISILFKHSLRILNQKKIIKNKKDNNILQMNNLNSWKKINFFHIFMKIY